MLSAPSIRGSKQIMHFSNRSNYRILAPGLILWRLYSAPNGRIFDGNDRPSMWSDIQSSSDGRPSTLCPEWSWEIFNAFCSKVFFTPKMLASNQAHHLIKYGVAPSEAPDVYNYTVVWDVANLVSRVGCFSLSLATVKSSHVSFQSAVSASPTGVVCSIVCASPRVSLCKEEEITAIKEWNWDGETFLLSLLSRTKEEEKKILTLLCRQHLLSFWYKWTKGSKIVIWIMPFISPWFLVKQFSPSL